MAWNVLHQVGAFKLGSLFVIVAYPLVPWVAVMAAGFCLGPVFQMEPARRQRVLLAAGIALTIAFLALRGLNLYGDPARWTPQPTTTLTALSFLNTTKYPPSLAFLLMTLGPALVALAWLDRRQFAAANPLIVFGRVPLFYFVVHFYAAHLAAIGLAFVQYGPATSAFMFQPLPSMGGPRQLFPPGFGHELWVAYLVWIAIVIVLYPLCAWFGRVKAGSRAWWTSYT
jgi:uncharacterized membrane protein